MDDDHGPTPLGDTWTILDHVLARTPRLRALVFECERNAVHEVLPTFQRLARALAGAARAA